MPPVPLARVGLADPQRGHRPAAQHGGRVHRLARGHAGEPPAGAGAEVAGALRDHGHVGAEHVPGGQQPGVQRDRLQVAAERLARRSPSRPASPPRAARRRCGRTRPAAPRRPHHVGDRGAAGPRRGVPRVAGQHRGQRGVQVGHHHRHAAQVVGVAQQRRGAASPARPRPARMACSGVYRALTRCPGPLRSGGSRSGHRDDQRVAAGAQAQVERGGVEQHPVAGLRACRSAPGRPAPAPASPVDRPRRAPPRRPRPRREAPKPSPLTPPDHSGRVASALAGRGATGEGRGVSQAEDRAAAQPGRLPAVGQPVPDRGADPRRGAGLPGLVRGVQADVRARQGRAARAGHPAGDRHQRRRATTRPATGSRAQAYELPEIRLEPDEAAVLGPGRPGLAAGRAGRGGRRARCSSCGRPGIDAEDTAPAGHRAAAADRRGRVRPAVGGGPGPPAGRVRLPRRPARSAAAAAPPRAVGRGQPARPLVRGRASTATGRAAGVPAQPDRRPGQLHRAAGLGRPCRPGTDVREAVSGPGTPSRPREQTARAAGPGRRRVRAAPPRGRRGAAAAGRAGTCRGAALTRPAGGASTWPRSAPTWSCWSPPTCARP